VEIVFTIAIFLPLMLILWLANLAERKRSEGEVENWRVLAGIAYALLGLFFLLLIVLGGLLHLAGVMAQGASTADMGALLENTGLDPAVLPSLGFGMWLPSLLGLLLLLPPVRRLLARLIPIDAGSAVHAVALAFSTLILVNLLTTLGVGLGTLADMVEETGPVRGTNIIGVLWAQDLTLAVLSAIGVGWLARRPLFAVLERLGIVVPSVKQALAGIGVGLLMVPIVLVGEVLSTNAGFGPDADVARLSELLIGPLAGSILGILTMGLAAAIGEETLFRGALQPRFGLLLTSALFALLHSTYGLSLSTVIVFGVGIVIGLIRRRFNTTTAMIVHAVYNMTLGLISYLGMLEGF
jgi:uncharacterized protein